MCTYFFLAENISKTMNLILVIFKNDCGESGDTVVFGDSGESDDSDESGGSGKSCYSVAFGDSGETVNSVECVIFFNLIFFF